MADICLCIVRTRFRSKNAHARDARAITPSGTPTPAPIAVSWHVSLSPLSDDDIVGAGRIEGLAEDDGAEPDT